MRRTTQTWRPVLLAIGLSVCFLPLLAQVRVEPPRPRWGDSTFTIEGSIVDPNDRPIPHARLILSVFGTEGQRADVSNSDGRFAFARLPEGSYTLRVSAGGFVSAQQEIRLVSVSRTNLKIVLAPEELAADRIPGAASSISTAALQVPKEAQKLYEKGLRSHRDKKYDDALKQFAQCIDLAPSFARAHAARGVTLLQLRRGAEARAAFEKALESDPESFDAHLGLGLVLNDSREFQAARDHLMKARELHGTGWQVHYELGRAYFNLSDYSRAEASLKTARESDPNYPNLYLLRASVFLAGNKSPEALAELQAFLERFPDAPMAGQVRERIKQLKTAH